MGFRRPSDKHIRTSDRPKTDINSRVSVKSKVQVPTGTIATVW